MKEFEVQQNLQVELPKNDDFSKNKKKSAKIEFGDINIDELLDIKRSDWTINPGIQ